MFQESSICFVLPPTNREEHAEFCPIGVGIIAAILQKKGHSVRIIDAGGMETASYWEMLNAVSADVIGIGGTIPQLRNMIVSAKVLRRVNPNAWIFFAGHGVLFDGNELLLDIADALLLGEGEESVPKLLCQDRYNINFPAGWKWKDTTGTVRSTGFAPKVDLNKLPKPAWESFPLENYLKTTLRNRGHTVAHIMTSRGCIQKCTFCDRTIGGNIVRRRTVEGVLDEMLDLAKQYESWNLRDFYFFDPSFFSVGQWRTNMLHGLRDIGTFTWGCEARIDEVDRDILVRAKDAGCTYVNFGVETADDDMLQTLSKNITVRQIENTFDQCHDLGISPGALLIIGIPGETRFHVEKMKKMLKRIRPTFVNLAIATPFPKTQFASEHLSRTLSIPITEFGDYYPERTMFTGLELDPAIVRSELSEFYLTEVNPKGLVNPC